MASTLASSGPLAKSPEAADHPEWYASRWLSAAPDIALLAEPGHVNSYLVVGGRRALLFDSGMGIRPLVPELERFTGLPLLVVNSHDHADHRGGNHELAPHAVDLAVHPAGMSGHRAVPAEFHAGYAAAAARAAEGFAALAALDRCGPFTLTPHEHPRPLPDLTGWRIPAVPPTRALDDGEVIDLGDRTVTVLHTPGHSPDSLCLWDPETRTLLSGDTVLSAAYWAHQPGADVGRFAHTLARLAELPARSVLVAHNLRAVLDADAVHRAAHAMAAVAGGRTAPYPDTDALDRPVARHDLTGVTILTEPEPEPVLEAEAADEAAGAHPARSR